MTEWHKVLVVDNGERLADHGLSMELAELGYASVTTSVEATDEVLELFPSPAAILIQLPDRSQRDYHLFMRLAARLKAEQGENGVPVILVDGRRGGQSGSYASMLESEFASHALSKAPVL